MSEIIFEKPKILNHEQRLKEVEWLLFTSEFITKKDIADCLGWTLPKYDRQIRMIIADISQRQPIISTSDNNKGYKLAQSKSDCDMVKHSLLELQSRIDQLRKRSISLQKFLKHNNDTITLFD
jgi:hypothetical protein